MLSALALTELSLSPDDPVSTAVRDPHPTDSQNPLAHAAL